MSTLQSRLIKFFRCYTVILNQLKEESVSFVKRRAVFMKRIEGENPVSPHDNL